jgi:hypothetical protein
MSAVRHCRRSIDGEQASAFRDAAHGSAEHTIFSVAMTSLAHHLPTERLVAADPKRADT